MNKELEELKEYLIKEQEKCKNYHNPSNFLSCSVLSSIIAKIKEIETNKFIKSLIDNGY